MPYLNELRSQAPLVQRGGLSRVTLPLWGSWRGLPKKPILYLSLACIAFLVITCRKDEQGSDYKGYPLEVGKIILTKCAIAGCHTDKSKEASNGLSLESWSSLFNGSRYGNTAVIPYRSDISFLSYFINTYSDLGISIPPAMPPGKDPLTREEVITVRDWINLGAPARNGLIPFSDMAHRRRMFVVNQGCDNVFIIDAATGLIMRSVDIGVSPSIESPHFIEISPDEEYFYTCFFAGSVFQKFNINDGTLAGEANIGSGQWSVFEITPDGKRAFVVDWSANGSIAVMDLETMTLLVKWQGNGLLQYPHGTGMKGNNLYVTSQPGNFFYKIDFTDIYNPNISQIPLQANANSHEIHFSQDGSEYAVSCVGLNEIWFFNASNDALIAKVATGKGPEEPHYAGDTLFVTCPNDDVTFPGKIGAVSIINGKTHTLIKNIYTGWEPHGIVPDVQGRKVWILHRNIAGGGPPPHHSSSCSGRNGYMTAIDLNTLDLIPNLKPELSVDPYFGAIVGHHH
ncbi:MAG: YncE family protein [Bacteroidetes bacterium]|nr:YncE family protein [Bacteroidota bacterium]